MPKVKSLRQKAAKHQSAPKVKPTPSDSAQGDQTEPTETATSFTSGTGPDDHVHLNKKERRLLKRELFQEYVTETLEKPVHSKSAKRRATRRERERREVDMRDMKDVLKMMSLPESIGSNLGISATHLGNGEEARHVGAEDTDTKAARNAKKKSGGQTIKGMIGESARTKPLTKAQKQKELKKEQKRLPLILSHPAFLKDPFGTIRTHNANAVAHSGPAPAAQVTK
ncbi:hypothetical protein FS842_003043 [Serendipita sp. 407]|nr:hypothetical protein FS842_003043 [Serendipita sp. 407]